jgi:NADPH-dependent 2,4-dienoyl-CoA reductase/sulfur reductase-like enzyme
MYRSLPRRCGVGAVSNNGRAASLSLGVGDHESVVVIVGGGFGGLAAAKALKNAVSSVVLIARTNHHLFQPLL